MDFLPAAAYKGRCVFVRSVNALSILAIPFLRGAPLYSHAAVRGLQKVYDVDSSGAPRKVLGHPEDHSVSGHDAGCDRHVPGAGRDGH